ncbi:MAG: hypothetical protein EON96_18620, partial [Caulobacteraceae bacterium]
MLVQSSPQDVACPALNEGLEEVCAAGCRDMAGALVFALARLAEADERPVLMAVTGAWRSESGRPYSPGFRTSGIEKRARGLILTAAPTEAEALWVMEQSLRSGAVSAVLGTIE